MKLLCLALMVLVAEALPTQKAQSGDLPSIMTSPGLDSDEWLLQRLTHTAEKRRSADVVVKQLCSVILENELKALQELTALQGAAEDHAKERPCRDCDQEGAREETLFVEFCREALSDMNLARRQ